MFGAIFFLIVSAITVFSVSPAFACSENAYETNGRDFIAVGNGCNFDNGASTYGAKRKNLTKTVNNGPKIRYEVTYYQECSPEMTLIRVCVANSDAPCADGSYPLTRLITPLNGPRAGQLISMRQYCSLEPALEVPGAAEDIAKVTPDQFRRMPILASTIISQPENFSLRNGNAHMYADSENQNFNIVIFDQDVR